MSELRISARGLGKRYPVTPLRTRPDTLRDLLAGAGRQAAGRLAAIARGQARTRRGEESSIWALRDLSFEVARGEVLGIIGANGAGKSTLLKVLSRITTPTTGEAEVRGRVGSLLEVGTGFHPELSGRENIYLNGAILGMRRAEIGRKFDEIVAFAEVDQFIDMPVKRYSSGMYLRLAFAVAAHLEPEILIVDEVLAVGDAAFQRKCLGRMSTVAGEGRTVLFVSHNMDAVQRLCSRCLHLERGTLVADGDVAGVVTQYLRRDGEQAAPGRWLELTAAARRGTGEARFVGVRYASDDAAAGNFAHTFGPLEFELLILADRPRSVRSLAVFLRSQSGAKLINADTLTQGTVLDLHEGLNRISLRIRELCLNPGIYEVGLWVAGAPDQVYDHLEAALHLEVLPDPAQGLGITPRWNGLVAVRFDVAQLPEQPTSADPGLV